MIKFKEGCHKLYEITRNEEYVNDMNHIISVVSSDKQRELMFLIFNEDNSNNARELARFLMSYKDEISLSKLDDGGMNVWHHICKLGHLRMLKLLINMTPKHETIKYLNMMCQSNTSLAAEYGSDLKNMSCLPLCLWYHKNLDMIKYLINLCCDDEWKNDISIDKKYITSKCNRIDNIITVRDISV